MLAPPDGGLLPVTSRQEMRQEKLAEEERMKKEEERNLLDKVRRKTNADDYNSCTYFVYFFLIIFSPANTLANLTLTGKTEALDFLKIWQHQAKL